MYAKPTSDRDLLQLIQNDDTAAFETLYHRYWKELYLKASQRVDKDEAKDLVQEVMISLWRRRKAIVADEHGELGRYLFTALKYRIISHYAFSSAEIKKAEIFEVLESGEENRQLETKELQSVIESAISRLPTRMQQIFRMSREDDVSISDIAKKLNISEQTVKNQLTEALRRLRETLQGNAAKEWALILVYIFIKKG
jgi:RNA polymerase sigma-70 factor (family 1)